MRILLVCLVLTAMVVGCSNCHHGPGIPDAAPAADAGPADAAPAPSAAASDAAVRRVVVLNETRSPTTVYVAFGADSAIQTWPFCEADAGFGGCVFALAPSASRALPVGSVYFNATLSFGGNGCGATKAELNIGNPAWSNDTADVSLVDGYSNKIEVRIAGGDGGLIQLGPPVGRDGNVKVYGVFPYGCDVCVARQAPPCGITPCGSPTDGGACGCKAGSQYNPAVPCQWSGPRGFDYLVALTP